MAVKKKKVAPAKKAASKAKAKAVPKAAKKKPAKKAVERAKTVQTKKASAPVVKQAKAPKQPMPTNHDWTLERCRAIARKFQSLSQWQQVSPASYKAAISSNWMKECCEHMQVGGMSVVSKAGQSKQTFGAFGK